MKKTDHFLLPSAITYLFISTFWLSSCFAYQGGSGIPSCHDDIAVNRTEPGSSPNCTPPILNREKSREILEGFNARKIKGKWYIFLSAEEFEGQVDIASRWKSISLLTSAVESMFSSQEECFLARIPMTDEEKEALLAGEYPRELIAASAKHVKLPEEQENSKKWPEYHHQLFYIITVY